MKKKLLACLWAATLVFAAACTHHTVQVEPIQVAPIHITVDINIRVDKALDDFFSDIDAADPAAAPEKR